MLHAPTFTTTNYPRSTSAYRIAWACSCGKKGGITDGRLGASMRRARAAHRRHAGVAR